MGIPYTTGTAMKLSNFASVVSKYKAVFFDAFGVLKNYNGVIKGIEHTFDFLAANGMEYFVLTNDSSRSPELLAAKYREAGIEAINTDHMISSGMLAREYFTHKLRDGEVVYMGTEKSAYYLEGTGLDGIPISEFEYRKSKDVRALVLLDEEGFDWNRDLNKAINLLRQKNIPIIVANSDETYPVSKHEVNIAIGGIADMLEAIVGKKVIRFGKPSSLMFLFAFQYLQQRMVVRKEDILMVGDTLQTDIIGGNKFGIDTALVLTGNTSPEMAKFLIKSTGIIPDFVCKSAVL